jgi:trehalose 6-phosphate phosphatase
VDDILNPRYRPVLARFAQSRALVAFDFDGTLAPIVDDPEEARMRPSTAKLLRRLCSLYPCIVISGRSCRDVCSHLRGSGVRYVVGNHGGDLGDAPELRRIASQWKALLLPALAGLDGVRIEDKGLSLTIHYRQSPEKEKARRKIFRLARGLRGARLIPSKQALNVVPEMAPHKGMALEAQRTKLQCDTALYVGDDVTDEDAFAMARSSPLLGIRVGAKRDSLACFRLRHQKDVDELLRLLVELREGADRSLT